MKLQKIHKLILVECTQDNVGLWSIIWKVNQGGYAYTSKLPARIRLRTIEIIRDLLQDHLVEAGNLSGSKFHPLTLSVDETIAYIEQEWDKLGRTPNIGDICWFRATPAGIKLTPAPA